MRLPRCVALLLRRAQPPGSLSIFEYAVYDARVFRLKLGAMGRALPAVSRWHGVREHLAHGVSVQAQSWPNTVKYRDASLMLIPSSPPGTPCARASSRNTCPRCTSMITFLRVSIDSMSEGVVRRYFRTFRPPRSGCRAAFVGHYRSAVYTRGEKALEALEWL